MPLEELLERSLIPATCQIKKHLSTVRIGMHYVPINFKGITKTGQTRIDISIIPP